VKGSPNFRAMAHYDKMSLPAQGKAKDGLAFVVPSL